MNKTGVINGPLSQPTVSDGIDFQFISISRNGHTTCVKILVGTVVSQVDQNLFSPIKIS